jgi:hypothetical protein
MWSIGGIITERAKPKYADKSRPSATLTTTSPYELSLHQTQASAVKSRRIPAYDTAIKIIPVLRHYMKVYGRV